MSQLMSDPGIKVQSSVRAASALSSEPSLQPCRGPLRSINDMITGLFSKQIQLKPMQEMAKEIRRPKTTGREREMWVESWERVVRLTQEKLSGRLWCCEIQHGQEKGALYLEQESSEMQENCQLHV